MRQLEYNNAAFTMVFEFPPGWDIASITAVNITVKNTAGTTLLAETAATIYTATTLNGAVAIGDSYVTLANTATACVPGRQYEMAASAAGPAEVLSCHHYDGTNYLLYGTADTRSAHTTGTAVKGAYCTYDLDTSTVATWPVGTQCVIQWAPVGSDDPSMFERAEISISRFGAPDFEQRFEAKYPIEYDVARGEIGSLEFETYELLKMRMKSDGVHLDRLRDTNDVMPTFLALARYIVLEGSGDSETTERNEARENYDRLYAYLAKIPAWQDLDQDEIQDPSEVDTFTQSGSMNARGL